MGVEIKPTGIYRKGWIGLLEMMVMVMVMMMMMMVTREIPRC